MDVSWLDMLEKWKKSSEEAKHKVIRILTFLACIVSEDYDVELRLMNFDVKVFTQTLEEKATEITEMREDDCQQISLLRHILAASGGAENINETGLKRTYTFAENLRFYTSLLNVEGKLDFEKMQSDRVVRALARTKTFGWDERPEKWCEEYSAFVRQLSLTGFPGDSAKFPEYNTNCLNPDEAEVLLKSFPRLAD